MAAVGVDQSIADWRPLPGHTAGDEAPKLVSPPTRVSGLPVISDNGRYVAYITNIVRQHGEQQRDQIFLWDREERKRHLISQDNEKDPNKQGEGNSLYPAISGDGSRVVYASDARDIDPECADGQMHIYMRIWDQMKKKSDCISKPRTTGSLGSSSPTISVLPAISGDGETVSWASNMSNQVEGDADGFADVFVWTHAEGIRLASISLNGSQGNGHSSLSSLDRSGNKLAFMSEANNLVSGDNNQVSDIFIRNIAEEVTLMVSVGLEGKPGNQISAGPMISSDGQHVVFVSKATNLVPNDTNDKWDVFVRHLKTGMTERVSVADGTNGMEANNDSVYAGITRNGRCVIFQSDANNLTPGDKNNKEDIYVRDMFTSRTVRVSLGIQGRESNDDSYFPVISADGSTIAYTSDASNQVKAGDRKINDPDVYTGQLPEDICR